MNVLVTVINGFYLKEEGASATEYSVLILLIIVVALVAIALLGQQVENAFETFSAMFSEQQSN